MTTIPESTAVRGIVPSPKLVGTCFECAHLLGLDARGSHGRCGRPEHEHVIARPEMACSGWTQSDRVPPLTNQAEWVAVHGLPIEGWNDDIRPSKFRPALTALAIRSAYQSAPSAQAQAMAWDIARLHDALFRAHSAITAQIARLRQYADMRGLQRLADAIAEEPAVADMLREIHKRMMSASAARTGHVAVTEKKCPARVAMWPAG